MLAHDMTNSDKHREPSPVHKLEVRGLHKRYGSLQVLSPVDLDVRQGEFMTLLGPSGSGKTTLLMMVAGLTPPSGGALRIDGRDATFVPAVRRDIGMVFQNYALFPHLTIFENIAFPLRMRRQSETEIRKSVMKALDMVELGHVAQRQPKALSGGQQQRIALARSLVYAPGIILMDEPLGALDKRLRDQLQLEIKSLHRSLGTTILYVTHDQQETLTMSDRICLMNHGRVEQVGNPAQLYFSPHTEFGAKFLGESNLVDVVDAVVEGIDTIRFHAPSLGAQAFYASTIAAPIGGKAKMMLRPESLSVSRVASMHAGNSVTGMVEDIVFTGEVTRYFVRASGGARLSVVQLTGPVGVGLTRGETVSVSWAPERTYFLPSEEAAS